MELLQLKKKWSLLGVQVHSQFRCPLQKNWSLVSTTTRRPPVIIFQGCHLNSEEQATWRAQQFCASDREQHVDIVILDELQIILENCKNSHLQSF